MLKPASRSSLCPKLTAVAILVFTLVTPVNLFAGDAAPQEDINRIRGKVVDHTGNPVEGVKVAAANAKLGYLSYSGNGRIFVYGPTKRILLLFKARNGSASAETLTDANGEFVLSNLMDGPVHLAAAHPEHGAQFLENINPLKDGKPLEITLPKPQFIKGRIQGISDEVKDKRFGGSSVYGRLVPANPLPKSEITFNIMTVIAADGHFRAGPIPNHIADWKMTFDRRVPNYSAMLLELPISVSTENASSIDLDLKKGHRLTGTVLGPDGKALNNVSVTARRSDGVLVGAVSDKKGKYEINGVTEGTLKLEAKRWARRTAPG